MDSPNLMIDLLNDVYASSDHLKATLDKFLSAVLPLACANEGRIYVIEGGADNLKVIEKAALGFSLEEHTAMDMGIIRAVAETKRHYVRYFPTETSLGFPVFYQSQVIAVMILVSPERIGFEPGLLDLLRELADHLSHLIRRAQFARWTKQDGLEARLVGKSQAMMTIEDLVEKFARSNCPVLITGETGTGKELIARAIHFNSPRKHKAFVAVNCGAFTSDDLLASELFGHVKGAFTDAKFDKKGKFELSDGGTIFLDEVSCMRPAMQVALLRVLRYGEIQKVGDDNATRKVNVRVVAASNQDLKRLIEEGRFREDVYYRLAVAEIKVPPLRDRKEDSPLLVEYFLEKFSGQENLEPKSVSSEAMKALMSYSWPNNIAGLENIICSALLLAEGQQIELEDLPEELRLLSFL